MFKGKPIPRLYSPQRPSLLGLQVTYIDHPLRRKSIRKGPQSPFFILAAISLILTLLVGSVGLTVAVSAVTLHARIVETMRRFKQSQGNPPQRLAPTDKLDRKHDYK
jgi:hypothetical protein